MARDLPDLSHLARPGVEIACRVTPGASRDRIEVTQSGLRVHVTAPPEDGRANAAVQKLLAKAMGVAKTRLVLRRGARSRDKLFVLQ